MLVFAGFRKASRWARRRLGARNGAVAVVEGDDPVLATTGHHGHHGRLGHHHHDRPVRDDDDIFPSYGRRTSFGVGMIHGVGAETPTQVLIFLAAGGAGGPVAGVLVLVAFILGLLTSNTFITVGSSLGFLSASRNFAVYATIAVLTGVFSLFLGVLFVAGRGAILPAFFGT